MNPRILNYVGGSLVAPESGKYLSGFEPATGRVYCEVADSDEKDVERAVTAAGKAFLSWSQLSAESRASYLRKISQIIEERKEMLARAESIDNGKPLSLSLSVDIPRSAKNFSFFADAATQFSSEFHGTNSSILNYTLRTPLGVVGCISPWNLPLYLLTWKIAPALAAGCTVVAKPSEMTPMTAYLLSEICIEAGLPPGVLNFVHGTGARAGAALVVHPEVKAISFTGSTKTGAEIARLSGPQFKKVSLEMGGKNPTVVFSDCDLSDAVETAVRSSFTNQGQICLCGSRIYVERSIYDEFKKTFIEKVKKLKVGDPLENGTDQGALVSEDHYKKVLSYLELAKKEGGKILCGGSPARLSGRCEGGWFFQPTVIEGLTTSCRTNQEEIFGPIVTISPFDSEEQAVTEANGTRYGLAASVWTKDLDRAHRVASKIQAGIVWINCWMVRDLRTPFGGVKESGVGREGGLEAMRFFTEPKNVCLKVNV